MESKEIKRNNFFNLVVAVVNCISGLLNNNNNNKNKSKPEKGHSDKTM